MTMSYGTDNVLAIKDIGVSFFNEHLGQYYEKKLIGLFTHKFSIKTLEFPENIRHF